MIKIIQYNESYVRVLSDDLGVEMEMSDYFTFFASNYRYHPKFKAKIWNGKIRLLNLQNKLIFKGLLNEIIKFCKSRDYEFEVDAVLKNTIDISLKLVTEYVDKLNLYGRGNPIDVREYQYDAVHKALSNKRQLLVSPTSSGKSLIIYSVIRWHILHDRKILIIVPTTNLVEQLFTDFQDYSSNNGFNVEENASVLYSGKERIFDKPVVISTWQSLMAMMKSDKDKFEELVNRTDVSLFDEVHLAKSTVILSVLDKFIHTEYRLGTTGTLDGNKINELTLTGLIGPIYNVITTKQLMNNNQIVDLSINCIVLKYPEHIRKAYKGMDYKEEIDFLVGYENRNKFIARIATTIKGNTLILFNYVERHGAVLDKLIRESTDRPVFFIHGGVDVVQREEIRQKLDSLNNAIVIATASLMSTGVNIVSLENIIFATPSKSTIRVRQSIGRGLRLKEGKTKCNLYDIADDLSMGKYRNTTLKHLEERLTIYIKEKFEYSIKHLAIT